MQAHTKKGKTFVRLNETEKRRLGEAKDILITAARFTGAQVFDAAADGIGDAIAAVDKLNEALPLLDA